jgi:hypothetical protein
MKAVCTTFGCCALDGAAEEALGPSMLEEFPCSSDIPGSRIPFDSSSGLVRAGGAIGVEAGEVTSIGSPGEGIEV